MENAMLSTGYWTLSTFRVEEKEERHGIVEKRRKNNNLCIVSLKLRESF